MTGVRAHMDMSFWWCVPVCRWLNSHCERMAHPQHLRTTLHPLTHSLPRRSASAIGLP